MLSSLFHSASAVKSHTLAAPSLCLLQRSAWFAIDDFCLLLMASSQSWEQERQSPHAAGWPEPMQQQRWASRSYSCCFPPPPPPSSSSSFSSPSSFSSSSSSSSSCASSSLAVACAALSCCYHLRPARNVAPERQYPDPQKFALAKQIHKNLLRSGKIQIHRFKNWLWLKQIGLSKRTAAKFWWNFVHFQSCNFANWLVWVWAKWKQVALAVVNSTSKKKTQPTQLMQQVATQVASKKHTIANSNPAIAKYKGAT